MGYSGKSEYVLYRDRQKNLVRHLNEKYKLSNLNPTIARQIIENAIRVNLSSSTVDKFLEDADLCERARVACLASVAAQATFMNIGCLALDPAGGIGILCHAAVLAYQTAESAQCNITAEQCKKNNSTLTIE